MALLLHTWGVPALASFKSCAELYDERGRKSSTKIQFRKRSVYLSINTRDGSLIVLQLQA